MAYQDKLKPLGASGQSTYASKLKPIAPQEPVQTDHGFVGNMAADFVRPFARAGTNIVQLGALLTGNAPKDITTLKPFSGSFLGDVKAVGDTGPNGDFKSKVMDSLGVGAELASNIPVAKGAGITFNVLKNATKEGGIQALKSAAVPLAKEGFQQGFLRSGGEAAQKSSDISNALGEGVVGGIESGVVAPLFGAGSATVGAGLRKYTNAGKLFSEAAKEVTPGQAAKQVEKVADYTRPILDKDLKSSLKKGKVESEYSKVLGLPIGEKKYNLTDKDYLRAQAVGDIVKPGFNKWNENIARLSQNIKETYDNQLIPFLKETGGEYEMPAMQTYLNQNMKPSAMLRPGSDSRYAFDTIKKRGLGILERYPKTNEGVQRARSEIDNMIDKEFGPALLDNTNVMHVGAKDAALQLRTALNDFTHDNIRTGGNIQLFNKVEDFVKEAQKRGMKFESPDDIKNQLMAHFGSPIIPDNELKAVLFRNKLKNLNLKLEAVDNMWDQSAKEVGKNLISNRIKDPMLRQAATYGGVAAGAGILGGSLFRGSGSGNNTN